MIPNEVTEHRKNVSKRSKLHQLQNMKVVLQDTIGENKELTT